MPPGVGEYFVRPGQEWEVDMMRPSDAEGVARLFISVYGKDYPIRTYINPKQLIEENEKGNILSAVARTKDGHVIGHNALIRSATFDGIRESAAGLVHVAYRGGKGIFTRLNSLLEGHGREHCKMEGLYGEPILNHVFSQKMSHSIKSISHALEVDQMPASTYEKEGAPSGRVSALVNFKTLIKRPHSVYVPQLYGEELRFLYADLDDSRDVIISGENKSQVPESRLDMQYFEFAKVARMAVWQTGEDFEELFEQREGEILGLGGLVIQVWISLKWPWINGTVRYLREKGYFFGGLLPRWFDCDGVLMQKVLHVPNWEGCQLCFERGRQIFEMVKADWERSIK